MPVSKVRLPREVRQPFQVYLNGVPQELGNDYVVREGALVFERDLRKDKISGWRWLLGAWGSLGGGSHVENLPWSKTELARGKYMTRPGKSSVMLSAIRFHATTPSHRSLL